MHRWLFVGLAIMAAIGGVGTALVSGQRVQNPSLGLELIAMSEEASAAGYVVRLGDDFQPGGGAGRLQIPDPEDLADRVKTAEELAADHTARLKEIVAEFGWPGKRLVGHDGAHAAWELLQQSRDDEFRVKALGLMQKMPAGQVDPVDLAVMTDRVAMQQDKPQTYGTQVGCDTATGELEVVGGLVDPDNVNERRATIGLPPFDQDLYDAALKFGACERN